MHKVLTWRFLAIYLVIATFEESYGLDQRKSPYDKNANIDFLNNEANLNKDPSQFAPGKPTPNIQNKNKVKDLIGFFDGQAKVTSSTPKSYSSILKGKVQPESPTASKSESNPLSPSAPSQQDKNQNNGYNNEKNYPLPSSKSPSIKPIPSSPQSTDAFPSLPNKQGINQPHTDGNKKDIPLWPSANSKPGINQPNTNKQSNPSIPNANGQQGIYQPHTHNNQGINQPSTPKTPSFSSVVAGPKGSNQNSQINPNLPSSSTPKPLSRPGTANGSPNSPSTPLLPSAILSQSSTTGKPNSNGPSDAELQALSEELLRKDTNNAAKYITVNYQGQTSSSSKEDKAPQPLLTVSDAAWKIATIEKFVPLLDNYERDTQVNEYITHRERLEENEFMAVVMTTPVIRHLMNYLKEKGYVGLDLGQQRDYLKQLWFNMYSRGGGKISSSGFEHVFVSELKNGEVSGLHNWIYFAREETANRVNYLGYLKKLDFNDKGAVLKLHFNQQGVDKPVDTMFIGTSPELEMALYSLCFVTRADKECNLKLGGKTVNIITHTFRYRSKNMIGSAYPQI